MENIILYDWLSFTVKSEDTHWIINNILGLGKCPWENVKGARGYQDRLYFNCISIHYHGREDMGIWVEMSGQGCRAFEELTSLPNKWEDLFENIQENRMHITRLDVAYDDHNGTLDINQIIQDCRNHEYVSKSDYWEIVESSKGQTLQHGSPQSDVLIRIYDKAKERKCPENEHWIRAEIQLRNDRATAFTKLKTPIGTSYKGVMMNYLKYVEPNELDSNMWRWPLKAYWSNFLDDAERISIYTSPGTDYNEERLNRLVFCQAGNGTAAYIEMHGVDDFLKHLENRPVHKNPKYDRLVEEHKRKKGKTHKIYTPPPRAPEDDDWHNIEAERIKKSFDVNYPAAIVDRFNRRWIKCRVCGRVMQEIDFYEHGGKEGPNLGTCIDCGVFGGKYERKPNSN